MRLTFSETLLAQGFQPIKEWFGIRKKVKKLVEEGKRRELFSNCQRFKIAKQSLDIARGQSKRQKKFKKSLYIASNR